jgi:hypothetical protein
MNEFFRPIEPGFSVTDAGYPTFELRDGYLQLSFTDWREQQIHVTFNDVIAVKWQELELIPGDDGIEGTYVVEDSHWFTSYVRELKIGPSHQYKHFRFDFNVCGSLEVICVDFSKET